MQTGKVIDDISSWPYRSGTNDDPQLIAANVKA
jgi:hypothetical protein